MNLGGAERKFLDSYFGKWVYKRQYMHTFAARRDISLRAMCHTTVSDYILNHTIPRWHGTPGHLNKNLPIKNLGLNLGRKAQV